MKVYVVTQGRYSDYHIIGVTLDKKLAEKAAEFNMKYGRYSNTEAYIEEWETDDFHSSALTCVFEVDFDENGNIIDCEENHWADEEFTRASMVIVRAKDEEHAKKIAIDRRAMYLAAKEGIA